ncbi:amidase family protein [Embleya sp. NPDC020886]|uniref:amidase family protein n=1 Tax=Embleya sp. NPDC020886 TaxID=3363980 RepID=UPI00378B6E41
MVSSDAQAGDLCAFPAHELAALIRSRHVSAREVVLAHLERLNEANPLVNAIVTRIDDRALQRAEELDRRIVHHGPVGPLHGLPVAHKDGLPVAGVRTTFGSLLYENHVPTVSALVVERQHTAGAITIGKTNMPEFGIGTHTANAVFGITRNPYAPNLTSGGSSGGAAAALACGMVALADGTDQGGSLRNPASFCNVVGLRPTPGRVPMVPTRSAWFDLPVVGPMARTVDDIALMLSAVAGPDPRDPFALPEGADRFAVSLDRDFARVAVAFGRDLGGLPFEDSVLVSFSSTRAVFEAIGCDVTDDELDFTGAEEVFRTLRAWGLAGYADDIRRGGDLVSESVRAVVEHGRRITAEQIARAYALRTRLAWRAAAFFERYEFLVVPVCQTTPQAADVPWVRCIGGVEIPDQVAGMLSTALPATLRVPVVAVPCGFDDAGLPFGVQIMGRPGDDLGVLQLAKAVETACGAHRRKPVLKGS